MAGAVTSTAAIPDADIIGRVLVVDDSVVARAAFSHIVDGTDRFMVARAVGNVPAALDFLAQHQVDIILLDIEMPGIDGLSALPDVIAAGKGARVLIVSGSAREGAAATIQALALGAADTLVKPDSGGLAGKFAEQLEEKLSRLLESKPSVAPTLQSAAPRVPAPNVTPFGIVAIGASTGGIHALSKLLREIPAEFDYPILVTQHLPATFIPYFAAQLAVIAGRPCDVAENHMRLRHGRLVVAPGHAHIRLVRISDGVAIRLSEEASTSGCTPSVDPMFASVAEVYGPRALCVVLSGMGRDGSIGARAVIAAGGTVLAQDRTSSVVWGMPGAVATAGCATAVLPPDQIGRLIARGGRS